MKLPTYDLGAWLRIVVRAILIFIVFDGLFIALRPFDSIELLSVYGTLLPYHIRLAPEETDLTDQLMPVETLLNAHIISRPKSISEYRIIVLGDSGISGAGNPDSETVWAYLSAVPNSIGGKQFHAFNLAWPVPSAVRDLVIADAALKYQPDLIVWFVTMLSFANTPDRLIEVNPSQMARLAAQFQLDDANSLAYGRADSDIWWRQSILFKRRDILQWLRYQVHDFHENVVPKFEAGTYKQKLSTKSTVFPALEHKQMPNPSWNVLPILPRLSGVPVLIVNEPILISPPSILGADVNYNEFYSRVPYDQYRDAFETYCHEHKLWCLDIWDLLPPSEYTNSPLHHTAAGNAMIAARVLEEVKLHLSISPTPIG